MGIFCFVYGVCRFWSDSLRVNDKTVLGMTGAQYFALSLVLASAWIWFAVRPKVGLLERAEAEAAAEVGADDEAAELSADPGDPGDVVDESDEDDEGDAGDEGDDASAEVEDGAR